MITPAAQTLRLVTLAAALLAFAPVHAAVNDILPGDFFPQQPGTTTLALYAYDRDQDGPYRLGRKPLDGRLESQLFALRVSHQFTHDGSQYALVGVLPYAGARVSPPPLASAMGERAEGLADLRFGLTRWLILDREHANYLAIGGMLIAPTGDYSRRQVLNVGENRWRFVLFGGWQKDLTPRLLFELSPEIAWYGDNDAYAGNRRLEQRNSHALTGYLRLRATPTWHLHFGAQINRGGGTRIDGVDQRNPPDNDRLMAGMSWFLPGQRQVLLRLGRDTAIDNGFRTRSEVALRVQQSF